MHNRSKTNPPSRRQFLGLSAAASAALLARCGGGSEDLILQPGDVINGLEKQSDAAPIAGATWYVAENVGDGLSYTFEKGRLSLDGFLSADLLLEGHTMTGFKIELAEGETGAVFTLRFFTLNSCQARIRVPLSAVDLNRWRLEREGAWLKPICGGERIDPDRADRMTFTVLKKSETRSRFCLTPFRFSRKEPEKLKNPLLPKGPLLDDLGQSTLHSWPGRSSSADEVTRRLRRQAEEADAAVASESLSRFGGWKKIKLGASGFFRVQKQGDRWWLVDPQGYPFWSAGVDCVRVDTTANCEGLADALTWRPEEQGDYEAMYSREGRAINYLAGNFIRAFGPDSWYDKWAAIALSQIRKIGFNTVGNWSDWAIARRAAYPYVRPMSMAVKRVKNIYRDFPDVFDPAYEEDAVEYAEPLRETADDPALIGYFLMNEPRWGFSSELPATGMLYNTETCETRSALARFLGEKYSDEAGLAAAWGMPVTFNGIERGLWSRPLSGTALADLESFSERMVERYFAPLSAACRRIDPNHLNLGIRYQGVPPAWVVSGMRSFDVFSMNCYREKIPHNDVSRIHEMLEIPVMIGEWHFGALDAGLPSSGIGRVRDQEARGRAYRVYLEDAAADPRCVGAHWFTMYDQSALGRFDGENYNIGFMDVCNRVYQPLAAAARTAHERLYALATGALAPYDRAPEYLTKLY